MSESHNRRHSSAALAHQTLLEANFGIGTRLSQRRAAFPQSYADMRSGVT